MVGYLRLAKKERKSELNPLILTSVWWCMWFSSAVEKFKFIFTSNFTWSTHEMKLIKLLGGFSGLYSHRWIYIFLSIIQQRKKIDCSIRCAIKFLERCLFVAEINCSLTRYNWTNHNWNETEKYERNERPPKYQYIYIYMWREFYLVLNNELYCLLLFWYENTNIRHFVYFSFLLHRSLVSACIHSLYMFVVDMCLCMMNEYACMCVSVSVCVRVVYILLWCRASNQPNDRTSGWLKFSIQYLPPEFVVVCMLGTRMRPSPSPRNTMLFFSSLDVKTRLMPCAFAYTRYINVNIATQQPHKHDGFECVRVRYIYACASVQYMRMLARMHGCVCVCVHDFQNECMHMHAYLFSFCCIQRWSPWTQTDEIRNWQTSAACECQRPHTFQFDIRILCDMSIYKCD